MLQFARALGYPEPVTAVPPTWIMTGDRFDPAYERSLARMAGGPAAGAALEALLHVDQAFGYERPLRIGETLAVERRPPRTWVKQGRRAGRIEFIELATDAYDADGQLVVSARWVDARTERAHSSLSTADDATTEAAPPLPDGTVVVERLTRTQIVMYVGAAGDYHPLHHDDVYARAHGYPSVFAPGMLTMGLAGRALTDAGGVEPDAVRSFEGRFRGQVWPGDTLVATVGPLTGEASSFAVELVNQHGAPVFTGRATVA